MGLTERPGIAPAPTGIIDPRTGRPAGMDDPFFVGLNAELSDPRFSGEMWKNEIELMLRLNKKAEQQSLAKYGLDFVTDRYLPEKLGALGLAT